MIDVLIDIGQWFRHYQFQSAMAIVATLLVLFGHDINKFFKKLVSKQHVVLRSITFILVCSVGYGLLTVWLTGLLALQLAKISDVYIFPSILGVFIVLSFYAQKQNHI